MKRTLSGSLFLFCLLLFFICGEVGGTEKNQVVVGEMGSGASSPKETNVECQKKTEMGCKEEGEIEEERVFDAGDYIYTNSNP